MGNLRSNWRRMDSLGFTKEGKYINEEAARRRKQAVEKVRIKPSWEKPLKGSR